MRRIRILGPCLAVALLAVACAFATSASANLAAPAWYECPKAGKEKVKEGTKEKEVPTGAYEDKLCSKPAPAGKYRAGGKPEGKYELEAGVGSGKSIKGKSESGEAPTLLVKTWLPEQEITCKSAKTESGVAEMPNIERGVKIAFKGCTFAALGGSKCSSVAPAGGAGEIKTKELTGELGYVKETKPIEVGVRFEASEVEAPIANFNCGTKTEPAAVTAEVFGQVIGVQTGDVNVVNKDSSVADAPGEYYGEHEYEGNKYKPAVNIIGWASEAAEILTAEEENKEERAPAHVLRGLFCGPWVRRLLSGSCPPLTYTGLKMKITSKGEPLMIKAEEPAEA